MKQIWINRLQAAVVGLIIGSIIFTVSRLWGSISQIDWHVDLLFMIPSILLVIVTMFVWAFTWAWLIKGIGQASLPIKEFANIYIYGNAAKYVPGAVWNYFARAYLGKKAGIGTKRIWLANILEFAGSIITGFIIYLLSLLWPNTHSSFFPISWILIIVFILFVLVSPPILKAVLSFIGRFNKTIQVKDLFEYKYIYFLLYVLCSCIIWILIGIAFFIFIRGVYPIELNTLPAVVGIWSVAVSIGMLAIGLPQGIGIKDGFLAFALSTIMPFPIAVVISLLSRAWIVACDLFMLLFWWIWNLCLQQLRRFREIRSFYR